MRASARALFLASTLSGVLAGLPSASAWAQGAARDQSGTLTAKRDEENKGWFQRRFAGSYAELTTYIGSGSFYASGYRDPYVSNALYLRPSFQLGTKYDLSLNGRVYLEEEYTQPDNPVGRHFSPLDTWLFLSARNLYTHPGSKIRLAGTLRTIIPTSYESRYAHLIGAVGVGGSANRGFELGHPDSQGKRWKLALSFGTIFTKYIRSSALRGNGPDSSSGCQSPAFLKPVASHTGPDGQATASDADRCGGVLNTNFSIITAVTAALARNRWSLTSTLIVINEVRYSMPNDQFTDPNAVATGRADWTWAILALGYDLTNHVGVSVGLSSYQPALNARNGNVRFPFFDLEGPNYYNYTQAFVGLNGTI